MVRNIAAFWLRAVLCVLIGTLLSSVTGLAHAGPTTTTLTLSKNPAREGEDINLVATVTGTNPTGNVQFKSGTLVMGTLPLSAGSATFILTAPLGTHSLSASYVGNSGNSASNSNTVTLVVNAKVTSTTALTVSSNPAGIGQNVTMTAAVTGTTPSGTVTFKNGTTTLGTGTVSGTTATYTTSFATAGSRSLTAAYAGDVNNTASTSSAVSLVVNALANTTTTLASSANPSNAGQSVTLTATIANGSSPTGTVTFKDGATTLGTGTVSGTTATYTTTALAGGSHSLTAVYGGNGTNNGSTSSALTQVVKANTTTSLAASPSPSLVGQSVTLTATIAGGSSPSGTVTFKDGTATLGTGTVSGTTATYATTALTAGSHSLTAVYGGNTTNNGSTSSAVSQTVNASAGATTTTMTVSKNPAREGEDVNLVATVTGSSPTGNVQFKSSTLVMGTIPLTAGSATFILTVPVGSYPLSATYVGDANNATSTSNTINMVTNAKVTSTTALAVSSNPAGVGQSVTMTATVTGTTPSGTVTFKNGTTTLGTGTVSGTTATYTTSFATAGSRSLTAEYAGDVNNTASTSSAVSLVVNALANTTTTLASSANPSNAGQSVTLTATIANGSSPTGTVTFKDGATTLGTGTVSGTTATYTTTALAGGSHSLTAVYGGNGTNNPSTSTALTQVVNGTPTALPPVAFSAAPVVGYEYDAKGNPTRTTQAPGVANFGFQTSSTYDPLSRRKDTTDAKLGKTQFAYDGLDRTTQVTDPRNLVTQYARTGLGDTTQLVSPDTGTANQTYDAAGNLKTRTDSRGALATYTYDALNRPTALVFTQSGQTSQTLGWTYDQTGAGFANGIGRLTSTSHPTGSTQYTYDAQGRLIADTQRVSAATGANSAQVSTTVTYGYDAAGHVTSIVYPSGRKLAVGYVNGWIDSIGLAKDTATTATTLISSVTHTPFGAPKSWLWQLASGTQLHERVFDTAGRLARYRLGSVARDLSYDAADRITGYTHRDATYATTVPALDQSFTYDELGRLTGITMATASWSIGYDANGNRTGVTLNATTSVYTTPATSNRLASTTNPARSFSYDNAGNTTADTGSPYTSTYDVTGRLATLTKAGVTTTYSYDAKGQRVRKFSSSGAASTVIFVYDQAGQILGEYSSTGVAIREYVWVGSTPIAIFTPDPANPTVNPPLVYYVHTDHLDTPRAVLDKSNNLRWRWMAEPFGTTAPETNPQSLGVFTQNLRFPGQYADSESGLSYNYFRDYDSSIGRYVQSDPIGLAGGTNTYAYVENNPVSLVDPTGEWGIPGFFIGAGIDVAKQYFVDGKSLKCVDLNSVFTSALVGVVTPGLLKLGMEANVARRALAVLPAHRHAARLAPLQTNAQIQSIFTGVGVLTKLGMGDKPWVIGDDCECQSRSTSEEQVKRVWELLTVPRRW